LNERHKWIVSTNSIMDTIIRPVPTRSKRGPYRRHSDEFKRAAVARTLVAGASVSRIARELEINSNQLFNWRKRFRIETPVIGNASRQFLPVTVIDTPMVAAPLASEPPGIIMLTVGSAQLRLEGQVDAATLTLLLARLLP
jgi:transposase